LRAASKFFDKVAGPISNVISLTLSHAFKLNSATETSIEYTRAHIYLDNEILGTNEAYTVIAWKNNWILIETITHRALQLFLHHHVTRGRHAELDKGVDVQQKVLINAEKSVKRKPCDATEIQQINCTTD